MVAEPGQCLLVVADKVVVVAGVALVVVILAGFGVVAWSVMLHGGPGDAGSPGRRVQSASPNLDPTSARPGSGAYEEAGAAQEAA